MRGHPAIGDHWGVARFPVRDDGRRPMRYRLVAGFLRGFFLVYFGRRLRLVGLDKLPAEGGLLLACNHLSNLDPLLIGALIPRTLFAMAKRELFRRRFVAWVLRGCNVVPVDRGAADRGALRAALAILASGGGLMVFIEGTRSAAPGMQVAESGVGFLQRRSGVRVVPLAIWGTDLALGRGQKRLRRAPITIRLGDPLVIAPAKGRGADQEIADTVARAVASLLPLRYRGAYADLSGAANARDGEAKAVLNPVDDAPAG